MITFVAPVGLTAILSPKRKIELRVPLLLKRRTSPRLGLDSGPHVPKRRPSTPAVETIGDSTAQDPRKATIIHGDFITDTPAIIDEAATVVAGHASVCADDKNVVLAVGVSPDVNRLCEVAAYVAPGSFRKAEDVAVGLNNPGTTVAVAGDAYTRLGCRHPTIVDPLLHPAIAATDARRLGYNKNVSI